MIDPVSMMMSNSSSSSSNEHLHLGSGCFRGSSNNNNNNKMTTTTTQQQTVPTSSNAGQLQQQNTVDDVWNNIVAGRTSICKQEAPDEMMMTLEDFLVKAGAVDDVDVKIPPSHLPLPPSQLHLTTDRLLSERMLSFNNPPNINVDGLLGFGTGVDEMIGSGKRRAILEPLDKAAQQRQRRMIKNRESAARSRERKQAYQAELESLALKLEEENETLMKAEGEQTKKRYKQLMDNIIPVTEKQRPTRYVLRKVRSMEW